LKGYKWAGSTPALQGRFVTALHDAGFYVGQTRALTNIMKPVYKNLGLYSVEVGQPIRR